MAESYKFSHWGSTSEDILKGHFPLHRACRDGDVECLSRLLIDAQHGVYVEDNFYGWTPAHWAAYFGKLNCLMCLQEKGTKCDAQSLRLMQTPAQIAAFADQAHCLKWLLHCGARIDKQLACLRKLMQVTRVGADCDVKSSRFSQTPAHLAAFGGHPQSLLWLIQSGASADCQDYLGETPTHKAARTGSMECASLLVSHGAKLFIKNISGHTSADLARQCGHSECAAYLTAAGISQESHPQGIYEQQNSKAMPIVPCPSDVTTTAIAHLVNGDAGHQCNGVNGTHGSEECAMDDESMDAASAEQPSMNTAIPAAIAQTTTFHKVTAAGDSNGDVTINSAISNNQLLVAGQKRCREDVEEICFKRQKTTEAVPNGFPGTNCNRLNPVSSIQSFHSAHHSQADSSHHSAPIKQSQNGIHNQPPELLSNGHPSICATKMTGPCMQNSDQPSAGPPDPGMDQSGARDEGFGGTTCTSTAEEHHHTVMLCQGYDSMCYEAMYSHP